MRSSGAVSKRWPVLVLLLPFVVSCAPRAEDAGARPNLIVIVLDTTRADRCSALGYSRPTTPELASLAKSGTLYRNAWSPSCWTGPAHASLFTGLRPEHHGFLCGERMFLDRGFDTMAEILSRAGYQTGGFSCNVLVSPEFGLDQGFGRFECVADFPEIREPKCRWAHQRAVFWLEQRSRRDAPFFLFVNDMEPHLPYTPPADAQGRFIASGTDAAVLAECRSIVGGKPTVRYALGQMTLDPGRLAVLSDLYDAEVASLDTEIGRFLRDLRKIGALDNTVLVILADHGENLGDHGLLEHMFSLNRSVLHVPLLILAPMRVERGAVDDSVVRTEDLLPTVLELCRVRNPNPVDGDSLLAPHPDRIARATQGRFMSPTLLKDLPGCESSPVFLPLRSAFDGTWHLIRREDGRTELYHVPTDPDELRNLAPDRPEEVARMLGLLPAPEPNDR